MSMCRCTRWLIFSAIICGYFFTETEAAGGTDYHYPGEWYRTHAKCGQRLIAEKQSPINIDTTKTKYAAMPRLNMSYIHSMEPFDTKYWMDGGGFSIIAPGKFETHGAGVTGIFDLLQFHFHTPSEHTLDGKNAIMEVHLVHAQRGMADPMHTANGLLVVGVMFELGAANDFLEDVMIRMENNHTVLSKNESKGDGTYHNKTGLKMTVPHLEGLLPNDVMERFYKYPGSLTTPPCTEVVNWFVAATFQTMSIEQFIHINRLNGASTITNRPTQPVNARTVQHSFYRGTFSPTVAPAGAPCKSCGFAVSSLSVPLYLIFSVFGAFK